MESVTNPPKEILTFVDQRLFHSAQKPKFYEVAKRRRIEVSFGNPGDSLNIAQTAWRGFHIRLQCVVDVVVFLMPRELFVPLGTHKLFNWPNSLCGCGAVHVGLEAFGANKRARFHEGGGNCYVAARLLNALFD